MIMARYSVEPYSLEPLVPGTGRTRIRCRCHARNRALRFDLAAPHLERTARHDLHDEAGEAIVVRRDLRRDALHRVTVVAFEATAERVGHQLAGKGAREVLAIALEDVAKLHGPFELAPVGQAAGGVDRELAV